MKLEQTPAVQTALKQSNAWACRLGAAEVLPVHLLLGLLEEEEGRAALLLAGAGAAADAVRRAFAGTMVIDDAVPSQMPLGKSVTGILAGAGDIAFLTSTEKTLSTDQVLLSLVRHDIELRQALEQLGLNVTRLELDILGTQGPPLHLDEPLKLHEPPERVDVARILDAASNRAREGLRVLEDYCRFSLDDAFLTREMKNLRHDLAAALEQLPGDLLIESRHTRGDVGTTISTPRELERNSLDNVVQANAKRLQESLRSLEEFGKLQRTALGPMFESIRYRAYTLEQALVLGSGARQRLADARLYLLVTEDTCRASLPGTIAEAAAGGVQIVQLREKNLDDRMFLERARQVRAWTRKAGVLFIVNDRPDIARLVEADGVHLGQEDLPVQQARRILGPGYLVGVSTHNIDQVRQAIVDGASYIGVGPTFPSATKSFKEFPGLDFIRQASAETSLPAFAIGGITLESLPEVLAAGGRRVAIGNVLCQAEDPRKLAGQMRKVLDAR